eukprot:TRINITY_DN13261_c0_g1_i1.p1 TRINITY_DN13261_c0_g1~~TRINITY_DN13261_c0_g1_i1.p1  ORF type:complete len:306 (+),score=51.57 TRINITY_DN13261_c0_g1_i1:196-1113(+)
MYNIYFVLLFVACVFGHGQLTVPTPRSPPANAGSYQQGPVDPTTSAFICRNYAPTASVAITAGQDLTIKWITPAAHVGDCFFYITYDGTDVPEAQKKWFKIYQRADCKAVQDQSLTFKVPSELPSCASGCILRWEWYALHLMPNGPVEFYTQCVDVTVTGSANGYLPQNRYVIPGHLTTSPSDYWNPYANTVNQFFVGPPLAYSGNDTNTGTTTTNPTSASTNPTSNPTSQSKSGPSTNTGSSSPSTSGSRCPSLSDCANVCGVGKVSKCACDASGNPDVVCTDAAESNASLIVVSMGFLAAFFL